MLRGGSSASVTAEAVLWEAVGDIVEPTDAPNLSPSQLRSAQRALSEYFAAWTPPPIGDDEVRVSVGEQHLRGDRETLLSDLTLYAHSVVVRDPLERWLDLRLSDDPPSGAALGDELAEAKELREMFETGVLIAAPYTGERGWPTANEDYDPEWELAREASANPARTVLGDLPTSDLHWPLIVLEEDPDDPARDLSLIPGLPKGDLRTIEYLVDEELRRVADELRDEVSRSGVLKAAARDVAATAGLSAFFVTSTSAVGGDEPSLTAAAAGPLPKLLLAPLLRKKPGGYRGVMLRLLRD